VVLLRPVSSATVAGSLLWAVEASQLVVDRVGLDDRSGFANYDQTRGAFDPIELRQTRFAAPVSRDPGLDTVVAAGRTLWIVDRGGPNGPRILVVRT
jgi:hypothetical protein